MTIVQKLKKQSLRIKGILNDMYLLKKETNEWYQEMIQVTKQKNWFYYYNSYHRQYPINLSNDYLFLCSC
ncbi:hypothetical protein OL548_14785 [Lysinibacillus sp. MHQ-1]|nr:hypothetical protein OL548_14785 [Lysinibacillus sp. MHQ-1]